jgi:hypothetical protein
MIKLFDLQNGKIIPTEHCYTLSFLKDIMDTYPEQHLSIYSYLFYMTCPNPDINPYFNMPADEKEQIILQDIKAEFSTEDDLVITALAKCTLMYETATVRAYRGISSMLDRLAIYMEKTPVTHGRDGNITALVSAAKNFEGIRNSFKGAYKDLLEEQQTRGRGGIELAYDQK